MRGNTVKTETTAKGSTICKNNCQYDRQKAKRKS